MSKISGGRPGRRMFLPPQRNTRTGNGECGTVWRGYGDYRLPMNSQNAESLTSLLSDHDLYLFNEGSHLRLYEHLGCHPGARDGVQGAWFGVWAPDAEIVSI